MDAGHFAIVLNQSPLSHSRRESSGNKKHKEDYTDAQIYGRHGAAVLCRRSSGSQILTGGEEKFPGLSGKSES